MMLDAVKRNFAHLHPSVYPLGDSHRRSDVSGSTTAIRCDFFTLMFERRLTDFTARLTSRNIAALDRALALAPRPSWPVPVRSVQRIDPAKTREAGKVGIARVQLRAVLDREGSEVRVVDEVARRSEWFEELPDDRRMTIAWMDDDRTRLSQPASDDVQCPIRG